MSKSVLISVNPEWCELIANGKKTVEIRKTKPKIETPFKVYIYCTQDKKFNFCTNNGEQYTHIGNGKVIGEFVCDEIKDGYLTVSDYITNVNIGHNETCLSVDDISEYLGMKHIEIKGQHKFYGWHISDLKIYDKPRELSEFKVNCLGFLKPYKCDKCEYDCTESDESIGVYHQCCCDNLKPLTRPPQSWCYVEEVGE